MKFGEFDNKPVLWVETAQDRWNSTTKEPMTDAEYLIGLITSHLRTSYGVAVQYYEEPEDLMNEIHRYLQPVK